MRTVSHYILNGKFYLSDYLHRENSVRDFLFVIVGMII